jgi:hypothetical protein
VVFTTRQGKSRLKDYRKAYNEAIRAAFRDIENANYHYNKSKNVEATTVNKIVKKEQVAKQQETLKIPITNNSKPKEVKTIAIKNVYLKGKYQIGDYGVCIIVKDNDNFKILSGDENFEIAKVYKTSQQNIFIVKWVAYKQPQLLQLTQQGNIKIDTIKGVKEYNRTN